MKVPELTKSMVEILSALRLEEAANQERESDAISQRPNTDLLNN